MQSGPEPPDGAAAEPRRGSRRASPVALAAVVTLLAACGGGSSSQTPPAGATATPASSSTATPSGLPSVPAGVQFDPKPTAPTADPAAPVTIDPATLPPPGQGAPATCAAETPTWRGSATVAGTPSHRVAVATRLFLRNGSDDAGSSTEAALWRSTDGVTWTWVDLRGVLGDVLSELDVFAVDGGFIAVGGVLQQCGFGAPSTAVVLTSPDGVTWTRTADLHRPYSVEANLVRAVGTHLLLSGAEFVCDLTGGTFHAAAHNQQTRYWRSDDHGHTWVELPIASIGVVTQPAAPADSAACSAAPPGASYFTAAPMTAVVGARIWVLGTDGSRLASSTDLATWTRATLPSAFPAGVTAANAEPPLAGGILQVGSATMALTLTRGFDRRTQRYLRTGGVPNAWTSADGVTFTRLPQGRPLDIDGDIAGAGGVSAATQPVGSYRVLGSAVELDVGPYLAPANAAYRSVAGTLEDWQHCAAAPGAFCRFASLGAANLAGRNLAGIDLDSADLGTADLSGADLTGANLSRADGRGVRLTHARLARITAAGANLVSADLTGVDLSGADLRGAFLDITFARATLTGAKLSAVFVEVPAAGGAGVKLAGLDLTGAVFIGATATAALTHADFTGSKLARADFQKVDLTGSAFTGADLTNVLFSSVTCPDGHPSDTTRPGAAACRL